MHRIHNTATTFEAYDADLQRARLKNVRLVRAEVVDVDMEKSSFCDVNASSVAFRDVNFTGAVFDDCDFTGATINGVLVEDLLRAYASLRHPLDTP